MQNAFIVNNLFSVNFQYFLTAILLWTCLKFVMKEVTCNCNLFLDWMDAILWDRMRKKFSFLTNSLIYFTSFSLQPPQDFLQLRFIHTPYFPLQNPLCFQCSQWSELLRFLQSSMKRDWWWEALKFFSIKLYHFF